MNTLYLAHEAAIEPPERTWWLVGIIHSNKDKCFDAVVATDLTQCNAPAPTTHGGRGASVLLVQ